MPGGRYRVIVADPPWAYDSRAADVSHRAANPYPQMSIDAIRALPVASLAHDDAMLWLWTTNSHLREAFAVLDAWGFRPQDHPHLGQGPHRHRRLAARADRALPARRPRPAGRHAHQPEHAVHRRRCASISRKPDDFYALVESLCPAPTGGRLELFARQARPGWIAFGSEPERFAMAEGAQ